MPLISIKMYPGRTEEQKKQLALALVKTAVETLGTPETAFTVMFDEIAKEEWPEKVAQPEIEANAEKVYVRQGKLVKE